MLKHFHMTTGDRKGRFLLGTRKFITQKVVLSLIDVAKENQDVAVGFAKENPDLAWQVQKKRAISVFGNEASGFSPK